MSEKDINLAERTILSLILMIQVFPSSSRNKQVRPNKTRNVTLTLTLAVKLAFAVRYNTPVCIIFKKSIQ